MARVNAFSSFTRQAHADKVQQAVALQLASHDPVLEFFEGGAGIKVAVSRWRLPEVARLPACWVTAAPATFTWLLGAEVELSLPVDVICAFDEPRSTLGLTDKSHRALIEEVAYALTLNDNLSFPAEFPPVVPGMGLVERLDRITAEDEGEIKGKGPREGELVTLAQYVIVRPTYLYTLGIDGWARAEP